MEVNAYNTLSIILLAVSLLVFLFQLYLMCVQKKMIDRQNKLLKKQTIDQEINAKSQSFFSLLSYLNTQRFFENQRATGFLHQYVADMLEIICKLLIDDQIDKDLFNLILKEQVDKEVKKFSDDQSVHAGTYTLKYKKTLNNGFG